MFLFRKKIVTLQDAKPTDSFVLPLLNNSRKYLILKVVSAEGIEPSTY